MTQDPDWTCLDEPPPRRVLVVGSVPEIVDCICSLRELLEYDFVPAYDGPTARRLLQEEPIGVLFLTNTKGHGLEPTATLRFADRHARGTLPIVVFTARPDLDEWLDFLSTLQASTWVVRKLTTDGIEVLDRTLRDALEAAWLLRVRRAAEDDLRALGPTTVPFPP